MGKRQRITPKAILEIETNGFYYYAQILETKSCAFFEIELKDPIVDYSVLKDVGILFILSVYNDVITKGKWIKVGKMEIRESLKVEPFKFIQDLHQPDNFELYNPNTGEITSTTRQRVIGLECAAVWEASHVEDRLRDHFAGNANTWVEQLAIK